MRRIRTRLPTYLSTGFGALVDISNSPCDQAGNEANEFDQAFDASTVKSCSEIGEDCRQLEQRTDWAVLAATQCELRRRSVNYWIFTS
jgi:hypothetical protein